MSGAVNMRRRQADRMRDKAEVTYDKRYRLELLREAAVLDDETDLLEVKLGRRKRPSVLDR